MIDQSQSRFRSARSLEQQFLLAKYKKHSVSGQLLNLALMKALKLMSTFSLYDHFDFSLLSIFNKININHTSVINLGFFIDR